MNGYWTDAEGEKVEVVESNIYQNNYYAGDVDQDGKIDIANLSVFKGDTGVGGKDDPQVAQGETTSTYDNNWQWQPQFSASDFVLSTAINDWRKFAAVSFGWESPRMEVISLKAGVNHYEEDWDNRLDKEASTNHSWLKHSITMTTSEENIVTLSYVVTDTEGNVVNTETRTLNTDVYEASWKFLADVEGKGGFAYILDILDSEITIDNLKITDLGNEETVSYEFSQGNEGLFEDRVNN